MAETVAEVMAKFSADTSSMDAGLSRIGQEAQEMQGHVEAAGESFSGLGVIATVTAGVVVAKVHEMIHVTEEWVGMVEQAEIQFGALMGSSEKGQAMVTMLEDLAIKLGVPVQAMLDGSRNMEKFTQGMHGGAEDMKVMADVAAGTGQSISDLSNTVGRYYAMLARGQGGGGGRLGIQLGLSTEQVNQLSAMAKQGLDPEKIYGTLIGDLEARYTGAGEKMASGTMKGIRETFTGLKDQSIGTMFEPLMKGVEDVMNHVNKGLASEGFKRFVADVRGDMDSLAGHFDSISTRVDHFFARFEGHSFQEFLNTVHQIAPALGGIAGVLSGLSLGTLEHLPIIGQALAPLAGILTPATAGLIGFLLASKDTRDALMDLVNAVFELVREIAGAGSPIAALVSDLAPIAAVFIEAAAAVIHFVATTGPLIAIAKAIAEIILVVKIWNTLGDLFGGWGSKLAEVTTGHLTAAGAARAQAAAEEQLTAALTAQGAAAGMGGAGKTAAGGASVISSEVQAAASTQALVAQSATPVAEASSAVSDVATEVQGMTAAQTMAQQSGAAFAEVKNKIEDAGKSAVSFGTRAATAINGLLPVVAALVVGISLVTDSWKRSEASGAHAFEEWSKHNVTQGSTESLKGQMERINQLTAAGERLNEESAKYSAKGFHLGGDDGWHFMSPSNAADSKKVAGELGANKKQYDEALAQYNAMKTNEAALMGQFHMTQEQVESLAAANHIDLSGALTDVSAKFAEAATSADAMAKASEIAMNRIKTAAANVKQDIAGALGQSTVNLGASPEFDVVQNKLAEIGAGGGEFAGLANKLHDQGAAYASTTHQTTDYINEQKHAFDSANAAADRQYAITQAYVAHQHALESLTKSQEHYTDAVKTQSKAAVSLLDNENNMSMVLARRSNQHFELHAQLADLTAAQSGYGALVEDQISILNADQDAVDSLQRQYQSFQDELTQTEDAMKSLQAVINQPLSGEGAMKDQIQQNKVAQAQIQEQMSALTLKGVPTGSPEMVALQAQLNKLQAESQHLAAVNTVTFDNQHYQIDRASKDLREQSFAVQMQGATTLGTLSARAHDVTAEMDAMKGPLDAANARLRDQKTFTDNLASAVTSLIGADNAIITTNRGVRDSLDGVRQAEEAVASSAHGITNALRAVPAAAFDAALYVNSAMDSVLAKAQALIERAEAARLAAAGVAIMSANDAYNSIVAHGGLPTGTHYYDLYGHEQIWNSSVNQYHAAGAFMKAFASGGMESHFAQIARQGSPTRMWNEPETGGEAYIPLDPSKRTGALDVLGQVMSEFGVSGGSTGITIADGAIQIRIEVAGNAPEGLGDEVYAAVDGALQHLVTTVTAHGGRN